MEKLVSIDSVTFSCDSFAYARYKAHRRVICSVSLVSEAEGSEGVLRLRSSVFPFMDDISVNVPAFTGHRLVETEVKLRADFLSTISEKLDATVDIEFFIGNDVVASVSAPVIVEAYNRWSGDIMELAAFVTPNAAAVSSFSRLVSEKMKAKGEDGALDGYNSLSMRRSDLFASSVYDVLLDFSLVYSLPPEGFLSSGQLIRLADSISQDHVATCIDSTLLFASILESIHLNPFIIIVPGHAFVGAWLSDEHLPSPFSTDGAVLLDRLINSQRSFCVVESTMLTSGASYESACRKAEAELEMYRGQMRILDITAARLSGLTPLSMDRYAGDGKVLAEEKDHISTLAYDESDYGRDELSAELEDVKSDKITYWSRRLLDLSSRNILISLGSARRIVPLLVPDLSLLEDVISSGSSLRVTPTPFDTLIEDFTFTDINEQGRRKLLSDNFAKGTLSANLTKSELARRMRKLYYQVQSDIAESGANTLFLALGLLEWYEGKQRRYAPLILVPVRISRQNVDSYRIIQSGDETVVNYSILERIRRDYKIDIRLDNANLPHDEHGLDMNRIFDIVRSAVRDMSNWVVIPSAVLGVFSFSQFVIYNDLISMREKIESSPLTSALVSGSAEKLHEAVPEAGDDDIRSLLLPVSLDESQLRAVKAASLGLSFILQGPPGTGKSQTITAIIASALADGKKVLFVAEKRAALEVVQRNLARIGLSDFALELHSSKATKEHIISQLEKALSDEKQKTRGRFSTLVENLVSERGELSEMVAAVNDEKYAGYSLYTLLNLYSTSSHAKGALYFPLSAKALLELDGESLTDIKGRIRSYTSRLRGFVPLSVNQLYRIYSLAGDISSLSDVRSSLGSLFKLDESYEDAKKRADGYESLYEDVRVLDAFLTARSELLNMPVPEAVHADAALSASADIAQDVFSAQKEVDALLSSVGISFDEDIYKEDLAALLKEYRGMLSAGFFQKGKIQKNLLVRIQGYTSTKLDKNDLGSIIEKLSNIQKTKARLEELISSMPDCLRDELEKDAGALAEVLSAYNERYERLLADMPEVEEQTVRDALDDKEAAAALSDIAAAAKAIAISLDSLPSDVAALPRQDMYELYALLEDADEKKYRELVLLMSEREQLLHIGEAFITAVDSGLVTGENLTASFNLSYARTLIDYALETEAVLGEDEWSEASLLNAYTESEGEYDRRSVEELVSRLASRRPDTSSSFEQIAAVRRFISGKGKGTSIRSFLCRIPDYYHRFFPVFLMSPLSVSQYLDPSLCDFDIVIYDEASQLITAKAIPSLARASQAVIVGDRYQMPPTSFFMKGEGEEDFGLELDYERDLESILDDVNAISMQQIMLSCHYRSRHESLISFSNGHYYKNRLKTYPSVDALRSRVHYRKVSGYYVQGAAYPNPAEAQAVTDEVKRILSNKEDNRSIGIITFNERQQNAIRERLEQLFDAYPELGRKAFWNDDSDENADRRLFVKNLESVQGDERDIILFSICFGPVEGSGRIPLTFGPIIKAGGERRLNVAFSRARDEMIIFTIMNPTDLAGRTSASRGVRDLSDFLIYAAGRSAEASEAEKEHDAVKLEIARAIEESGYETVCDLGTSGYRIDVAVRQKGHEEFISAVMLDGPSFAAASLTREREILAPAFLRMRGWNVVKVHVANWYRDKADVIEKLLAQLESGTSEKERKPDAEIQHHVEEAEDYPEVEEVALSPYAPASYNGYILPEGNFAIASAEVDMYRSALKTRLKDVVVQLSPIERGLAYSESLSSFSISRMTARIEKLMDEVAQELAQAGEIFVESEGDDEIIWTSELASRPYTIYRLSSAEERAISDIPLIELANAIRTALDNAYVMTDEDALVAVKDAWGFTRRTNVFNARVQAAVDYGLSKSIFSRRESDEKLVRPEDN